MATIKIDDEAYYDIPEIRKLTRHSTRYLNEAIRTGRLRAGCTGRQSYVKGAWLRQWLEGYSIDSPNPHASDAATAIDGGSVSTPLVQFGTPDRQELTTSAV